MVRLDSLRLNERNPRTMSKDAFAKLCQSVREFPKMMTIRPMVYDKDRVVIGGTRRYQACVALGMTEVPDAWTKDGSSLTDAERKRFIVADNAPGGMSGEWDYSVLAADWELPELVDIGFDEDAL